MLAVSWNIKGHRRPVGPAVQGGRGISYRWTGADGRTVARKPVLRHPKNHVLSPRSFRHSSDLLTGRELGWGSCVHTQHRGKPRELCKPAASLGETAQDF